MDLKNTLRTSLIRGSAVLRLDELALRLQRSGRCGDELRVLVVEMHETPRWHEEKLRRQLEWVAKHFTLIDPPTFFGLCEQPNAPVTFSKPPVIFTFDDGRESNYKVAAPLLESIGGRGIFFPVAGFIGLKGIEAKDYYYSKIDIRGAGRGMDEEEWMPMTPAQLSDLVRRGHGVGNHTFTHARLSDLSPADLHHEIVESAQLIGSWIRQPVELFAWAYAWDAISREAWDMIKNSHRFCFAPCPGTVDLSVDSPHLIWRKEIEAYYQESEYRFMYSGLVDPLWAAKRRRLRGMLRRA